MRNITFTPKAFEDCPDWAKQDRKLYRKIVSLISDTLRQPFTGIGKPEALKHDLKGCWSRQITDEHRLVYKVTETEIMIVSCRFHYDD